MTERQAPLIDGHAHIFERTLPMVAGRRYTPDRDALVSEYLAELDANGFSHGVLVQPSFLGEDNRYLLAALAARPDRLRGVVVVSRDIAEEELVAMANAGVVGVRLNLLGAAVPEFADAAWAGFLARLRRVGLHIELACAAADLQEALPPLIAAGCHVAVDHFGRPDGPLGMNDPGFRHLLQAGSTGRVWVKLSAVYRMDRTRFDAAGILSQLLTALGPHRLVWGSDWPHTHFTHQMTFALALALFHELGLDTATQTQILSASAQSLFRIGPDHG